LLSEVPSFLKKRSKRLLFLRQRQDSGPILDRGSGGELKVFWFFSSEKNMLAFRVIDKVCPDPPPRPWPRSCFLFAEVESHDS
jgi:hypothetical protein